MMKDKKGGKIFTKFAAKENKNIFLLHGKRSS